MTEARKQVESELSGLLFRSESDYPLEFISWQRKPDTAVDDNFVREQLRAGQDANVEEADAEELLDNCCKIEPWFVEEELAVAQGFQRLRQLLNQHLKNLRLFRVGNIEVTVVLVGEDEQGNLIGFKTTSIET